MTPDALQSGQYLGDGGAAAFKRFAERPFAVVQWFEPAFGFGDPVFGVAQPRGAVDQGLVELAAVLADGVNLFLELGLGFRSLFLLDADRLKLLVALAERIELGLGLQRKQGKKGGEKQRQAEHDGQRATRIGEPLRSSHRRVKYCRRGWKAMTLAVGDRSPSEPGFRFSG